MTIEKYIQFTGVSRAKFKAMEEVVEAARKMMNIEWGYHHDSINNNILDQIFYSLKHLDSLEKPKEL